MYGFDIYEYDGTPYYNMSTGKKLAWGAVRQPPDVQICGVLRRPYDESLRQLQFTTAKPAKTRSTTAAW